MAESVDALVSNTSGFTSIPVRSRVWVQKRREFFNFLRFFVYMTILKIRELYIFSFLIVEKTIFNLIYKIKKVECKQLMKIFLYKKKETHQRALKLLVFLLLDCVRGSHA